MSIKTLIATSAVALTLATGAMADANFTGAYVGGNFGYGAGKTDFNNNVSGTTNNAKTDLGLAGIVGGLHTGYQHQMGMFVLGAEASADLSNTDATSTVAKQKVSLKRKNAFGLAVRAGVAVNSWMMYAKLGWENAKFEAKRNKTTKAATTDYKKSSRKNALVTGLGVETVVANNVMVGVEGTYKLYKKVSVATGNNTDTFKPRVADFKVRLGYKF